MTNPFDLAGTVALVTGASQGLGRGFARTLARHGSAVALAARQTDKLDALRREIEDGGGRAAAVALDVTDLAGIDAALDAVERQLGPVTVLVNNAGIAASKPALEHTEADWDRVLDTNLKGAFFVAQAVAKRMVAAAAGGSIVNIASIMGLGVLGHLAAYCASKGGVVQFTRVMALELARHGIRVNAIAPGYIETDINRDFFSSPAGAKVVQRIPQRRLGREEELEGVLLLLASPASTYMTGSVVTVDGGLLLT